MKDVRKSPDELQLASASSRREELTLWSRVPVPGAQSATVNIAGFLLSNGTKKRGVSFRPLVWRKHGNPAAFFWRSSYANSVEKPRTFFQRNVKGECAFSGCKFRVWSQRLSSSGKWGYSVTSCIFVSQFKNMCKGTFSACVLRKNGSPCKVSP